MKPYEIIEHTADVGLKVYGLSLKGLFENAAKGMFDIIGGERIHLSYAKASEGRQSTSAPVHQKIEIKKEVEDFEELLVDWLSELLYIFNKAQILFSDFKILELNNSGIVADLYGEKIDFSKDNLHTEIKACTFHNLKIEEDIKGFSCKIIFDV